MALGSGPGFGVSGMPLPGSWYQGRSSGSGSRVGFETSLLFQLNNRLSEEKRKERGSSGWGHVAPLYTTGAWPSCDIALPPIMTHSAPSQPSSLQPLPPHSITSPNLVPGNHCHAVPSLPTNFAPLHLLFQLVLSSPASSQFCLSLEP